MARSVPKRIEISNGERMRVLGEAIYGQIYLDGRAWWKQSLSKRLGVTRKTVQRWTTGEREPEDETVCRVLAMAKEKRDELDRAIAASRLPPWIV